MLKQIQYSEAPHYGQFLYTDSFVCPDKKLTYLYLARNWIENIGGELRSLSTILRTDEGFRGTHLHIFLKN